MEPEEEYEEEIETGEEQDTEPPSEVEDEEEVATDEEETEEVPEPAKPEKEEWTKAAVLEERRKRQEMERKLQEIEQRLQPVAPTAPPKDIYEAYDRDPEGVTAQLNANISKLVADDPYGHAAQIEQLRDIKDALRRREVENIKTNLSKQTVAQEAARVVTTQIPDFQTKSQELLRFCVEELEYDPQEILARCDFANGEVAVKEILRINKMYDKLHPKPEQKLVRPKPTEVETGGKGIAKKGPSRDVLLAEAKRTGDFSKYLDAVGLLD